LIAAFNFDDKFSKIELLVDAAHRDGSEEEALIDTFLGDSSPVQ
jgi:hypothetical protein